MSASDPFTLEVTGGGPQYDRLVVEILYLGKYVATVTRESVGGPFGIDWDDRTLPDYRCLRCPLDGFLNAIDRAKRRLAEDAETDNR